MFTAKLDAFCIKNGNIQLLFHSAKYCRPFSSQYLHISIYYIRKKTLHFRHIRFRETINGITLILSMLQHKLLNLLQFHK